MYTKQSSETHATVRPICARDVAGLALEHVKSVNSSLLNLGRAVTEKGHSEYLTEIGDAIRELRKTFIILGALAGHKLGADEAIAAAFAGTALCTAKFEHVGQLEILRGNVEREIREAVTTLNTCLNTCFIGEIGTVNHVKFAETLLTLKRVLDLSAEGMGELLGVGHATAHRWYTGKTKPSYRDALAAVQRLERLIDRSQNG